VAPGQIAELVEKMVAIEVFPGDTIFSVGDVSVDLFILDHGALRLLREDGSVCKTVTTRCVLGELGIAQDHRTLTAKVDEPGVIFKLSLADYCNVKLTDFLDEMPLLSPIHHTATLAKLVGESKVAGYRQGTMIQRQNVVASFFIILVGNV